MTEAQVKAWLQAELAVSRETIERLDAFAALLAEENQRQNLVAPASLPLLWDRHILDSAQLLPLAEDSNGSWLDLGSGAGFPGLIIAALRPGSVTLVESRRLRVDFLRRAAGILGAHAEVIGASLERVPPRSFDIISARAFAPLPRLLTLATPFSTEKTRWLLPKGQSAQSELEAARDAWQGDFRLEQSLTDADARIIVATGVRRREARSK